MQRHGSFPRVTPLRSSPRVSERGLTPTRKRRRRSMKRSRSLNILPLQMVFSKLKANPGGPHGTGGGQNNGNTK